ncbi:hypothetical protein GCM10009864_05160 [Streptomyces lunalinharesii]|uniref:Uncharacterized protein n=1 Tax=Streptomyces lunalinharesii TaxID=333384 RepID=A0ABN3R8E9_9ACTN
MTRETPARLATSSTVERRSPKVMNCSRAASRIFSDNPPPAPGAPVNAPAGSRRSSVIRPPPHTAAGRRTRRKQQ